VIAVRPFRALRPAPALAAAVASPPYDVVSTEEARAFAAGNPHSFFHVSRPEIDWPDGTDPHADAVHAAGARALVRMRAEGALVEEDGPALYLYRLIMGGRAQHGLVGCFSVDDYDRDLIKKHEKTRPDKEDDRTRHILALRAHDEPVFLLCPPDARVAELAAAARAAEPLYDFTASDGVRHTLWRLGEAAPWVESYARMPALYVADGHHRSAAASRARAAARTDEAGWFPAVCFSADEVAILPYNRVVSESRGLFAARLLEAVREWFEVGDAGPAQPSRKGEMAMFLDGRWRSLRVRPGAFDPGDPVGSLDVSILQERLLGPVLGIRDPRTDSRIDFVGGIRGTAELERRAGAGGVAFSMFPVSVAELMAIADAGMLLPPKSTWFEPKLSSGLFVHTF
jgi:uncharacterized protein (DUF1015 family)